jgi:hypothetical protein
VEWQFSEPQPDWKPTLSIPGLEPARLERTTDALRVTLSEGSRISGRPLWLGGVYVDLSDWRREQWIEVQVSVRTAGTINRIYTGLDPPQGAPAAGNATATPRLAVFGATFQVRGGDTPIVRDGLVHTYRIHPDWGNWPTGSWQRVGFLFEASSGPGSIDILSVRIVPVAAERVSDRIVETILEPAQLEADFGLFRKALEEAHPALYHFATKREMDAQFAAAEVRLTRPMTILEFRNVLAPVRAAIKDGGDMTATYQGDEIRTLIERTKQFPLVLMFESMRGFVVLNQGLDERVKPGMEVVDIEGMPLRDILQRILPRIAQRGDGTTYQMHELGIDSGFFRNGQPGRAGFSEAYRLYVGDPRTFNVTLRDQQTGQTMAVDLAGVTPAEAVVNVERNPVNREVFAGLRTLRAQGPEQTPFGLSSRVRYLDGGDIPVLVPAFGGDFGGFLDETFGELSRNGTQNLIIDLRGNTGGFDQYPSLLFSYLTTKEFRVWDRNHMNTYQPSFKPYTSRDIDLEIALGTDRYYDPVVGIWTPDPDGGWLMTEKYPTIGLQKPAAIHFDGGVYILIDGACISACSVFAAIADFYGRATFIGEETGGVVGGTSAGGDSVTGLTLPQSHLHVSIPQEAYFFLPQSTNRRGVRPSHVVSQTIDDLKEGRDTVLEFTRELIRSGKGLQ